MQINKNLVSGLALVLLVVVGSVFFFAEYRSKSSHTIKIVTSLPMQKITVGRGILNGVKLALDEAHYTAGAYQIELVVKDDGDANGKWQEKIESMNATAAVADPDVMLYLGTYNSGAAKISIPITNAGDLAQLSPGNTWPGLTQPGFSPGEPGIFYPTGVRTYFRVCPTDALQGPAAALWAKELGAKSVYIFDDGEAYGKGIADLFENKAQELGLVVLGRKTLNKSATDFTDELKGFIAKTPDLIYFGGITPNGIVPLAKDIKALKLRSQLMAPDGVMEQAFIDQAGDAAEGAYITVVGVPPEQLTGKGKIFYDKYKAMYGIPPETFSVFGYEAAKVALGAIAESGTKDRERIRQALAGTKDYDGLFGAWSFDYNGDTSLSLVSGNVVHNKAFVFEKLLSVK